MGFFRWLVDDVAGIDLPGGDPKQTSQSSSSGSRTFDPYINQATQNIAGRANMLASRQFKPFGGNYDGPQSAINNALNTNLQHYEGQQYSPTQSQGFINQYMQASQPAINDLRQNEQMSLNQVRGNQGSSFGGSRGAIMEGQIMQAANRGVAGIQSNAINQGIGMGFNAQQANLRNRQQAAAIRQGQIQQALALGDRQLNVDQLNRNQPIRELGQLAQILATLPKNQYTQGSSQGVNTQSTPFSFDNWWDQKQQQAASAVGTAMGAP